ncbi:efflux RND transporter periplasmic adaptor subunit [Oscillatoria sp. CS-180]|uniref:efflux RND transporter periplasmic adaptor subunit n=1 Tax=Oscillatoria sp. CS-180 TaxID=3021720 RepID=UPI00232FA3B1|nr:efflux RND transporter periplasmic adaptor subunit [Oscillatoria sp. CS-180]MDB9528099.1 efflux RND transporter periplasmic adaptor subunit [Oscillatoria sp. CS-180]
MAIKRPRFSLSDKAFWLLAVGLVLAGGFTFWGVRSLIQARQNDVTETPVAPPQRVQVAALGRVEPAGRVVDVVPSENGRLSQLDVEEGDQVQADQILAYLDIYDVRQAERDYAASQLAEAQDLLVAQTQAGEASIQEAETKIAQVDQPQTAAIQAQQNTIDSLQADLRIAAADLARFEQLYADGAIALQEVDRQRATVQRLREQISSAQARKQELEAARISNMANAEAQVDAEVADLQLAQAQVTVDSATQNLALAEARLDQAIIRAPRDGQILQIYAEPGEAVTTSDPILALGNTEQMYVVAEVYETDVTLVEIGQRATITSRNGAFDQTLTGTVEQIGLQIFKNDVLDDDPAANADARVVEVRVRVDQSEVIAGLTNLQVDVAIDVES